MKNEDFFRQSEINTTRVHLFLTAFVHWVATGRSFPPSPVNYQFSSVFGENSHCPYPVFGPSSGKSKCPALLRMSSLSVIWGLSNRRPRFPLTPRLTKWAVTSSLHEFNGTIVLDPWELQGDNCDENEQLMRASWDFRCNTNSNKLNSTCESRMKHHVVCTDKASVWGCKKLEFSHA